MYTGNVLICAISLKIASNMIGTSHIYNNKDIYYLTRAPLEDPGISRKVQIFLRYSASVLLSSANCDGSFGSM